MHTYKPVYVDLKQKSLKLPNTAKEFYQLNVHYLIIKVNTKNKDNWIWDSL